MARVFTTSRIHYISLEIHQKSYGLYVVQQCVEYSPNGKIIRLVTLVDELCWEMDKGSAAFLMFLDLSATFDAIDHVILLGERLEASFTIVPFIPKGEVLEGDARDCYSAHCLLACRVLQGSLFPSKLFSMKPLVKVI